MKQAMILSVAAATAEEFVSVLDMMMEPELKECCSFWVMGDDDDRIVIWGALLPTRDN